MTIHAFLPELVLFGVGYHHAGLDTADRKAIELMFTAGDLPVLCKLDPNPHWRIII